MVIRQSWDGGVRATLNTNATSYSCQTVRQSWRAPHIIFWAHAREADSAQWPHHL